MLRPATEKRPIHALVVDDEPGVRLALHHAMDSEGWKVELAASGEAALEAVETGEYDLILADKNMPGMSGVELLQRVRERSRDVAFVLITGYGNVGSAQDALDLDVDGYIEKPFSDIFTTLKKIRGYVGRRRARKVFREAGARATEVSDDKVRIQLATREEDRQRLLRVLDPIDAILIEPAGRSDEDSSPDLIVTDEIGINDAVRRHPSALVAVLATTSALPSLLALLDAGANAVLDLTDDDAALSSGVESLLRRARAAKERES